MGTRVGFLPLVFGSLLVCHTTVALDGPELQQVFSEVVSQNVTSYSDLAQRLEETGRVKSTLPTLASPSSTPGPSVSVYDAACWSSAENLSACLTQEQKVTSKFRLFLGFLFFCSFSYSWVDYGVF